MKVLLDPGHGQDNRHSGVYDPGNVYGGIQEADYCLSFCLALKEKLEANGVVVTMTRSSNDQPAPLNGRARMAQGHDLCLSVHTNAHGDARANGVEVFYGQAFEVAKMMLAELVAATRLKSRGIKNGSHLTMIRDTASAALLLELGFMSNEFDRQTLLNANTQQAMTDGIAKVVAAIS